MGIVTLLPVSRRMRVTVRSRKFATQTESLVSASARGWRPTANDLVTRPDAGSTNPTEFGLSFIDEERRPSRPKASPTVTATAASAIAARAGQGPTRRTIGRCRDDTALAGAGRG